MKKSISNSVSFVFLLFFLVSCTKDNPEPLLLSKTIVGKWELREQWGFPYPPNEWHVFDPVLLTVEFKENGEILFESLGAADVEGTYFVIDSTNSIQITTNGPTIWEISEFDRTSFIHSIPPSDEGPVKQKYFKIE